MLNRSGEILFEGLIWSFIERNVCLVGENCFLLVAIKKTLNESDVHPQRSDGLHNKMLFATFVCSAVVVVHVRRIKRNLSLAGD